MGFSGTPNNETPPYGKRDPYYSHTTPIRITLDTSCKNEVTQCLRKNDALGTPSGSSTQAGSQGWMKQQEFRAQMGMPGVETKKKVDSFFFFFGGGLKNFQRCDFVPRKFLG